MERKNQQPSQVPERGELHQRAGHFTKISANSILLASQSKRQCGAGHTLMGVFGGKFRLEEEACNAMKAKLLSWAKDKTSRVPFKGPQKRSYVDGSFVSNNE